MELKEEVIKLQKFNQHIDMLLAFGFDLEGKVIAPLLKSMEDYANLVEYHFFGEKAEDLSYFMFDLNFGEYKGLVEIDGREYVIEGLDSFITYYEKEFGGGE